MFSGAYYADMARQIRPANQKKRARHFVKEWRKIRGMTQESLAERINSTAGAISQLENGLINYTQPTLESIALALDVSTSELLSPPPSPDLVDLMKIMSTKDTETIRAIVSGLPDKMEG